VSSETMTEGPAPATTGGEGFSRRKAIRIGLAVLLALLPLFFIPTDLLSPELTFSADGSAFSLATSAAVFAILAFAIAILLRFLDLPSGGHGALFGVGAYASAIGIDKLGFGFEMALVLAILATVGIGILMGFLALRTSGMAFLIITLALGELIVLILLNWDGLTAGPLGMFVSGSPKIFGIEIGTSEARYFLTMFFLYLTIGAVWWLSASRFGRRLIAIKENEQLAKSLGLDTFRYKLGAFMISAAIAGVAGHLYLTHLRGITPDLFAVLAVISVFLMVVMGGSRSLAGPVVGAWLVVFLPVWFEPLGLEDPTRQEFTFGVLLIVFMLLAPAGIMGGATYLLDRILGRGSRPEFTVPTPRRLLFRKKPGDGEAPPAASGGTGESRATPGEALLVVEDLSKAFRGVKAVDDVSFDVKRGEVVGIIGPNGSGKTTLVNCVTGFLRPTSGEVLWQDGKVTGKRPDALAKLGIVRTFQQSMSFDEYTPRQHCELVWGSGAEVGKDQSVEGVDTVPQVLDLFSLDEVSETVAADLPYGQVSNLGLASALATQLPEVLILDEPAAGLSSAEGLKLRERLLDLRDRGLTIVIIDHDMAFLMPMCDRIVVLDAGRKIAEGSPAEIQSNDAVITAYLGERFAARQKKEQTAG
jgi:branched-chain amino acid transport system permease protein